MSLWIHVTIEFSNADLATPDKVQVDLYDRIWRKSYCKATYCSTSKYPGTCIPVTANERQFVSSTANYLSNNHMGIGTIP